MAGRKFAALAGIKKQQSPEPEVAVPAAEEQSLRTRRRGRPVGKRSDPDYEPTTLLLRKATKKAAFRLLEDLETGQDLSDLVERLIAQWIRERPL